MRSLKSFVAIFVFALMTQFSNAADLSDIRKPESAQIQSILNTIDFRNFIEEETKVNISFIINPQGEVIVLATNSKELDGVVKNALNYKKIAVNALEYNKVYTVPVLIK